jgi:hypothetical protein
VAKNFNLAVSEANGSDESAPLPFTMQGSDEQLYAYRPTEGQLVLLMGVMSEFESPEQQAATVLDVFWSLLDEETSSILRRRLRDRNDSFALRDIMNIIEWVVEETAARPTQSSLDSRPSRATSGHLSTGGAPRKARTRSSSRPIASTT